MALQSVCELYHVDDVLEVLHEFLIIDTSVSINISDQVQSECFLLVQINKLAKLLKTLLVLEPLEEAILIDVLITEDSEHVASFVIVGHLNILSPELANRTQLSFPSHRFHFKR